MEGGRLVTCAVPRGVPESHESPRRRVCKGVWKTVRAQRPGKEPHELFSIHCAEPRASAGPHAGTSLAGGDFHAAGGAGWNTAGHHDRAPCRAEQAGAGGREHYSDHSQPGAFRIPSAAALAGRPSRPPGDSGSDFVRAAAHDSQHVYRNSRSRSGGGRSRAWHGADRPAAFVSKWNCRWP